MPQVRTTLDAIPLLEKIQKMLVTAKGNVNERKYVYNEGYTDALREIMDHVEKHLIKS